jgi:alpha-D-ribose 1-methylphosphonate 5-triphosphate diphosphatase PhnM
MDICQENINYTIQEVSRANIYVTYRDLLETLEQLEKEKDYIERNDMNSLEIMYHTQYSYKDLQKICEYYGLEKNASKQQLIQHIIIYEKNNENIENVYKRKKLWSYIEEIKNDTYLKKYLSFE